MKSIDADKVEFQLNATYQALLLLLITLLAAALRFYKLGAWSFWGDEVITVDRASHGLFYNGVSLIATSRILTWLSLNWFDISEWSARLPAALAGIVSIPILYFPIRKIFGPITALLAMLFLAVAPWHLYWSQNARFYAVLLLFYTLALLTFYIGIEKDRPLYLLLAMLFLGLAMMERLSSLLLMPVIVAYLGLVAILPFEKPAGLRLRNLILFFAPGMLAGIVLALPYLRDPARWWTNMAWLNNNPFWLLAGVVYYIGLPVICIGGLSGLYFLFKKERAALLLLLGAIVPIVVVMAISLFQYTANRYILVALPCWLILAALGAKELFWDTPPKARVLALGALAILVIGPLSENFLYYRYQNGNRDDWKSAFAYIQQQRAPEDLIVVPNALLGKYYLRGNLAKMDSLDLTTLPSMEHKVWFVEDMNVSTKWPHVLAWIHDHAVQVAQMDVHVQARTYKMRVYRYDPQNPSPADSWSTAKTP